MATRKLVFGAVTALVLAVAAAGIAWEQRPSAADDMTADDDLPIPPVPPRIMESADYDKCLGMLTSDPSGALTFAEAWTATGGGAGAMHCQGLANVELGDAEAGATLLDQVGDDQAAPPAARAAVLGQAVQSWMMAAKPLQAYASASKALALLPDDPDLLVDRALASSELEHYQSAVDDLSKVLEADRRREDALVLRATGYRQLGQIDKAEDDIDLALSEDPDDADALLERGILRQRRGDRTGARRDWERAVTLDPDSPTADLAQQNLALLDAGPAR